MKRNKVKLALDIAMAILFVTFFNNDLIHMGFHAMSGIVFAIFIIVHLVLNRKWIATMTKRLFDKKIKIKTKISYVLSLLLLVSMGYIIVSGAMIMKAPNYDREMFWKMVHFGASYLSLALIGIHIGLYWNWVMNVFKKILSIKTSNNISKRVSTVLVLLLLVFGGYKMYSDNYFGKTYSCLSYVATHLKDQGIEGERGISESKDTTFMNLASTYGSIIGVFTICTHYTDKVLNINKKNNAKSSKASA
ncbi:MAG: DUF4405 domain-containing protein [Romboutsia sp.]|nr:DUF4405 domain-containing protein [Romboutsia sp.]